MSHFTQLLGWLIILIVFSGCTSLSKHERLKQDVDQLQTMLNEYKHEEKINRERFEKAYSPKLHKQLNTNLKTSDEYVEVITAVLEKVRKHKEQFDGLAKLAQQHYDTTKRNAKESSVQNVVNQFRSIESGWESTLLTLDQKMQLMKSIVKEMQTQASQASQNAISASRDARKVAIIYEKVDTLENELDRMKKNLRKLKKKLMNEINTLHRSDQVLRQMKVPQRKNQNNKK